MSTSHKNERESQKKPIDAFKDKAAPIPVGEDKSKREDHIKQFRMTDGSWLAATYPYAVHYEENGSWVEIDNRLEEKEQDLMIPFQGKGEADPKPVHENTYVNLQNRFGVKLPVYLSEKSWLGVSDSGHRLFFRLKGVRESESVVDKEILPPEDPLQKAIHVHYNSTVHYPEALPGAELKYDVCGQALKETITFPRLEAVPEELAYEIWAEGMTAEKAEEGEIQFFAEGKVVFKLPAPFLMDREGNSDGALKVKLEELGEGCFVLRYTIEKKWLESEERVWPVVLDPVITNVVNTNYIRDAYIRKGYPNYGGGLFYFFYAGFYSNATKAVRGLVKHTQIPSLESGDVIVGAYLTAHGLVYQSNGTQIQVDAHAITGNWDSQTVKWNNQPAYEDEVLDFQIVNSTADKLYTWNVTSAVQRWYGGAASEKGALSNQGFMLISPTENNWNVLMAQFVSSDNSPSTSWPMLYIAYRNTTGLESYWDYTSAKAGRAGTVSANNYTGNLVVSRGDMSYSGNRMPASIAFVYNQNDCTTDIGYGKGWRSCYSQRLEQVNISGTTYYKWTDGDGTRIYFYYDNDKAEWIDENGLSYKLTIAASGYTITDRDENSLGFDANGRLTSKTDKLSNSLSVAYTESGTSNLRISRVTDGAGRVYDFSYSNNLLSSVVYKGAGSTALETVSYTYSSGALETVTYADGKTAGYSYDSNKLTEARDIQRSDNSCNKLNISYAGSPARVTEISYYDGATLVNSVSLRYGDHNTVVKDNLDRWCTYEFNNWGNTVSVYNQKGQALYGRFAADETSDGRANQLIHSSRLQDTVVNLLNNRTETGAWSETVTVQEGTTYSLSGLGAAGTTLSMTAGGVTQTATAVSSDDRNEVTLAVPSGVTSLTISGSGSYSDLQLEQAEAASRYNLLVNTDMSSSSGWTGTNLGSNDGIVTLTDTWANLNVRLNDFVLKLEGVGTSTKSYAQTISVSGSLGDDYSFGGWVKSGSVPLGNKNYPNSQQDRHCGIRVRLLNGSTEVDSKTLDANTDCQEWQFLSGSVRASGAYDTVEFSFLYDYNANVSYFDGAQLFREKFGYVYHYDDEGRIDKITDLEGRETSYTYRGTSSDKTSIQLPGGESFSYTYTESGLLQTATLPSGVTTATSYDGWGNPKKTEISSAGMSRKLVSQTTYTSDGNMTATVRANNNRVTSYLNDTERSLVMAVTDPKGNVTSNSYDVMRRPVTSQTGSSAITNTYNDDRLTGLSHTNTASTSTDYTLEYGTAELLSSVKVGSAYTLVQNSYDTDTWNLERQSYGNGDCWAYAYSEFDDLTARWTVKDGPGTEFRYFYNSKGALARVEQYSTTVANGQISGRSLVLTEHYSYDGQDRPVRIWETRANGVSQEYRWSYDADGRITGLTQRVGNRSYSYESSYNADGQLEATAYGAVSKEYSYDGLGRLSGTALVRNGTSVLESSYRYRDWTSTTEKTTTHVSQVENQYGNQTETLDYTYDYNSNISTVSVGGKTTRYSYDAQNELVREDNEAAGKTWVYSYDLGGNILSRTEYAYQTGATPTGSSSTVTYSYGNSQWPDLLTAYDGQSISYDGMGNPLRYRGWDFTWQGGRQLGSASDGTTNLSFVYNEEGLRTEKTDGNERHRYYYRGNLLVSEITDDYELFFHYDGNGEPVSFTYRSGGTATGYYYRRNLQGDIIGILKANGSSAAEYRYDAWGRVLEATGTMAEINPLRYRGYYYDRETGLYYLQSRYYDPEVGRFINADAFASTGQGILGSNMFAYCLNNPVKNRDYAGRYTVTTYSYDSEYEYEYGTVSVSGTIYIYQGDDIKDIEFFNDPEHRPEGFVPGRDVIVLDKRRNTGNPNMIVYQSNLITAYAQQDSIITELLNYEESDPSGWGRTRRSLHVEWFWHNVFADFSETARHTDFDHDEEGKNGWYFIDKAWKRSSIRPRILDLLKKSMIDPVLFVK